jgi:hypothetical protein
MHAACNRWLVTRDTDGKHALYSRCLLLPLACRADSRHSLDTTRSATNERYLIVRCFATHACLLYLQPDYFCSEFRTKMINCMNTNFFILALVDVYTTKLGSEDQGQLFVRCGETACLAQVARHDWTCNLFWRSRDRSRK